MLRLFLELAWNVERGAALAAAWKAGKTARRHLATRTAEAAHAAGTAHAATTATAAEHRAQLGEAAHFFDLLHHGGHFLVHLQQAVHLLHRGPRALGDADLAFGVEQVRLRSLPRRHRADDRVEPAQHIALQHAGLIH